VGEEDFVETRSYAAAVAGGGEDGETFGVCGGGVEGGEGGVAVFA